MGRRTAMVACLAALLVGALAPGAARASTDSRSSLAALEVSILAELNDVRAANGLRPLRISSQLAAAARLHTSEMLAYGYFEHDSLGGSPFWKRIQRFYSRADYGHWSVGENLLWSSPDLEAKKAVKLWLASPGHKQNILAPGWREIGISAVHTETSVGAFGGGAVTVITTDFGVRR